MSSTATESTPPLLGDGNGRYKVWITGNSGTGKTTTGAVLAALLGVPHIPLDELYWQPGWKESTIKEFQAKIRQKVDENDKGWVVDGDYESRGGDIVFSRSTDIIWLDPHLVLYFPRIIYRTVLGLLGLRKSCSPGCFETIREVFSKRSVLWWCLSRHWHCRRIGQARMAEIGLGVGTNVEGRRMRRFGGWGGELKRWLTAVERDLSRYK